MSTLLLRLAGPMQSWGTRSRFSNRDTGLEPSRSGVIGLLCAALGRPREASLADFRPLTMGVRVDREGRLMRDYHTAQGFMRASGKIEAPSTTVLSERFYLADADFLVGLEGPDEEFLQRLDAAVREPVWTLSLGRKAFLPGEPIPQGVVPLPAGAALRSFECPQFGRPRLDRPRPVRLIEEVGYGAGGEPRSDVPVSFVSASRSFEVRYVRTEFVDLLPADPPEGGAG